MAAIKDFFKKIKADVKFAKAGEGHSLSGDTSGQKPKGSSSSEVNQHKNS